jgi:hypothetical protein
VGHWVHARSHRVDERPGLLDTVMTGAQLLDIVGPAYAYAFERDELEGDTVELASEVVSREGGEMASLQAWRFFAARLGCQTDAAEHVGKNESARHCQHDRSEQPPRRTPPFALSRRCS